jgi:hypothetical protein
VNDVPGTVSQDLNFDVSWTFDKLLQEERSVAKGRLGLGRGTLKIFFQFLNRQENK